MTRRERVRPLIVCGLLSLATACGSTVSSTQLGTGASQNLGQGVAANPTPNAESGPPPATANGSRGPQSATGVSGANVVAGDQPTQGAGSGGASDRASGYAMGVPGFSQGITKDTISIGIVVLKNGEAFANGLGLQVSFGNTELEFKAIIDDLNKRGGILGRRVVPIIAYEDVTSSNPQGTLCPTFTQDHHVFAVLLPFNPLPATASCITKAHTLLLNDSTDAPDTSVDPNYPGWLFSPSLKTYSRYPVTMVRELVARGFFAKGAKAAILVLDDPQFTAPAQGVMKPALDAAGIPVEIIKVGQQTYTADLSSATLKLRQDGVTNVLFVQAGGGIPLYFMEDAEQQGYHPKYALGSYEGPGFLLQGNAPKAQLANAMGIGWEPFMDVAPAQYPTTRQEKRCLDLIAASGEKNANRASNITATDVCDLVWAFEAAAIKAGPQLSSPSWRLGQRALGTSYSSVLTFRTDFSQGRTDGSSAYRFLSWNKPCSCFVYVGPVTNDVR